MEQTANARTLLRDLESSADLLQALHAEVAEKMLGPFDIKDNVVEGMCAALDYSMGGKVLVGAFKVNGVDYKFTAKLDYALDTHEALKKALREIGEQITGVIVDGIADSVLQGIQEGYIR